MCNKIIFKSYQQFITNYNIKELKKFITTELKQNNQSFFVPSVEHKYPPGETYRKLRISFKFDKSSDDDTYEFAVDGFRYDISKNNTKNFNEVKELSGVEPENFLIFRTYPTDKKPEDR